VFLLQQYSRRVCIKFFLKYLAKFSLVLVAHACNPNYSGDRDQGDLWFEANLDE
jgi:hypothetical protein